MRTGGGFRIGMLLWLWPAVAFGADGSAPSAGQNPSLANPLQEQSIKRLSATIARPLFVPSRREPREPPQAAHVDEPPRPPAPPSVTLVGILKSAEARHAVLRSGGAGKLVHVQIGDEIGGWKVTEIGDRYVILAFDKQTATIALFKTLASKPAKRLATSSYQVQQPSLFEEQGSNGSPSPAPPRRLRLHDQAARR